MNPVWSREQTSNGCSTRRLRSPGRSCAISCGSRLLADYGLLDQFRVGNYNPDGSLFMDDNRRKTYSVKVSWQVAAGHQIHAYHQMQDKGALHRTADNPTEFYESRWTEYQTPNDRYTEQARWTGVMSSRVLAEVGREPLLGWPEHLSAAGSDVGDLSAYDSVTRTHMNSRPTYAWITQHRAVLQPTLSISGGQTRSEVRISGITRLSALAELFVLALSGRDCAPCFAVARRTRSTPTTPRPARLWA